MTNGDNSKGLPLWHGRLNVSSADVLKNLNSSIGFDIRLYKEDIIASKAHAKMLKTVGVYTESELGAVASTFLFCPYSHLTCIFLLKPFQFLDF